MANNSWCGFDWTRRGSGAPVVRSERGGWISSQPGRAPTCIMLWAVRAYDFDVRVLVEQTAAVGVIARLIAGNNCIGRIVFIKSWFEQIIAAPFAGSGHDFWSAGAGK